MDREPVIFSLAKRLVVESQKRLMVPALPLNDTLDCPKSYTVKVPGYWYDEPVHVSMALALNSHHSNWVGTTNVILAPEISTVDVPQ